jgi:hypothetical protein
MRDDIREALSQRQRQWEAFHRWQVQDSVQTISIAERIDWYINAFRLSQALGSPTTWSDQDSSIQRISEVRQKLAVLKS